MRFNLTKPCKNCPFRIDCVKGWLGKERAEEIWQSIAHSDSRFSCHNTNEFGEDEETGESITIETEKTEWCAGAMILLKKTNTMFNNALFRLGIVFGIFKPEKLDLSAPVFDTQEEFIQHHEGKNNAKKRS